MNPLHPGEVIRESMGEVGWGVTETAALLGCERGTLSRLLNGQAGVSENMALALEALRWGTAHHWMRIQASYEVAARATSVSSAAAYGLRRRIAPCVSRRQSDRDCRRAMLACTP